MRCGICPTGDLKIPGVQAEGLDLDEDLCRALDSGLWRILVEGQAGKVFAVGEGILLHGGIVYASRQELR